MIGGMSTAQAEVAPETVPEKVSRDGTKRGQSAGSKRTQKRGDADAKPKEPYQPPDFGAGGPTQLGWMEWVLANDAKVGEPPNVRHLRAWLKKDVRGFLAEKRKMEQPVSGVGGGPAEEDRGTDTCEEMYERLLVEWGEELR